MDFSQIVELNTRILCDTEPVEQTDGAYLFCQTTSNQFSVINTATSLLKRKKFKSLYIFYSKPLCGYPGFTLWHKLLMDAQVPSNKIRGVEPINTQSINTLIEAEALINFLQLKNARSVYVIAPPFQQLRAFMTTVTVALKEYPELLIYSIPAVAAPWQEDVYHSQGTLKAKRSNLIYSEIDRIKTYQKKGDLASCQDVISYLNNRDN